MSVPLEFDLRGTSRQRLSVIEGNPTDPNTAKGTGAIRAFSLEGRRVLGKIAHGSLYHTISLRIPMAGRYRLTYQLAESVSSSALGVVELKGVVVGETRRAAMRWSVDFFAQDSESVLLVFNRSGSVEVEAVEAERLEGTVPRAAVEPPMAHEVVDDPFVYYGSLDRAVATFSDTPKAIEEYAQLAEQEDRAVLDAALADIFPEGVPALDEADILDVLSYVAQKTKLKFTATPLGSKVLQQGFAYCNGMALAFAALCQRAGLPARINSLNNFEWMQAHNMAEVYYDGSWHLFDPTYGTFFYSCPQYRDKGRIPSLQEVIAHVVEPTYILQATEKVWTGIVEVGQNIRPLAPDVACGGYTRFTLAELYEHVLSQGFPIVSRDDFAASYPIDLDLRGRDEYWIGERDGDMMDLFGKNEAGRYPRYHGVPFLGKTRLGGAYHLFVIKVREPGRFRLTYHLAPGGYHEELEVVELKDVIATSKWWTSDTWAVEFYVQEEEALLLVANRYYAAYIDALHVQRISEPDIL